MEAVPPREQRFGQSHEELRDALSLGGVVQGGRPVQQRRVEDQGPNVRGTRRVACRRQSHASAEGVAVEDDAGGSVLHGVADGGVEVVPFGGPEVAAVARVGRRSDVVPVGDREHRIAQRVQRAHRGEGVRAAAAEPVNEDHPRRPESWEIPRGHATEWCRNRHGPVAQA